MSILWMDGPDHYSNVAALLLEGIYADVTQVGLQLNSGPGGVGTVFTFFGGGSSVGCRLRKVLPGNRNLVGIGYRIFPNGLPPTSPVSIHEWLDASSNVLAYLAITATGAIQLVVGGVAVYTSGPIIVSNSFQHIEAMLKIGATGAYKINVNGLPLVSIDSQNFPTTQIAQVRLTNSQPNGWSHTKRDFYVWDDQGDVNNSGMQGDRQVITSMPTGDTATAQWVPSTGSLGYALINQIPPIDSQFVYADTAGKKSNYDTADVSTDITSISAVMLVARAAKSDAGIGTMSLNMVSAGSTAEGVEQAISTEFIGYTQMVEKDPHTGIKWLPAGLNAAQVQLERVQ